MEIISASSVFWIGLAIVIVMLLLQSVKLVPQNSSFVIERFGKYTGTLEAGLNFIVPFIDRVAYIHTLKEQAVDIPGQTAITSDNITLGVDGILYLRVVDPHDASYGVENYAYAVIQLAQTTMRSEIGQLKLDKTFEERDQLNVKIVEAINSASASWGVQVLRYEIKDIDPPSSVLDAMEQQMKAERMKRAAILESEGERQSAINIAEGNKQARVLAAEADKQEQVLKAEGEAQAIKTVAEAQANALEVVGEKAATDNGQKAVQLQLAEEAIEAHKQIAKETNLVLLSPNDNSAANLVTQAMSIINKVNNPS